MVHGKQIKDSSIGLVKVNPASGQLLTLVGTSKIQVNAAPTVGIDLVNKDYVDALVTGLDFKESVRVASNGTNIVIATAPAAIDGVTLTGGDRVLLKDQTLPAQNGIYIFNGTGNAMTRSTDADSNTEVTAGMFMFVEEGTWADTGWVLSTNNPIVVGTTSLTFTQFSAAGVITADNGLTKTGNNIKLGGALTGNTIIDGVTLYDFELNNLVNFSSLSTGASHTATIAMDLSGGTSTITLDSATGADINASQNVNLTSGVDIVLQSANDITSNAVNIANNANTSIIDTVANMSNVTASTINAGLGKIEMAYSIDASLATISVNELNDEAAVTYYSDVATQTSYFKARKASAVIGTTAGNEISFRFTGSTLSGGDLSIDNNMVIMDSISSKGLVYDNDYSANFTNNSLVSKFYVDNSVAAGVSADNGLTKTGVNIQLGGSLIQNTSIDGAAGLYDLDLIDFNNLTMVAANEVLLAGVTGSISINNTVPGISLDTVGKTIANNTGGGLYTINTGGGLYTINTGIGNYTLTTTDANITTSMITVNNTNDYIINSGTYTLTTTNTASIIGQDVNVQSTLGDINLDAATSIIGLAATDITFSALGNAAFNGNSVVVAAGAGGVDISTSVGGSIAIDSDDLLDITSIGDMTMKSALGSGVLTAADGGNLNMNMYGTPQSILNNGTNNSIVITDAVNTKGIVYASDYSAAFTPESLITKRYVDDSIFNAADYANNGITKTGVYFQLGGALLQNTNIDGVLNAYSMTYTGLNNFDVDANNINNTVSGGINQTSTGAGTISNTSVNGVNTSSVTASGIMAQLKYDNSTVISLVNAGNAQVNESVSDGTNTISHNITTSNSVISATDSIDTSTITTGPTSVLLANGVYGVRVSSSDVNISANGNIINLVTGIGQTIANNGIDNFMVITDASASKGLVYATDYSLNFTPESLITKRYVDAQLTAGLITADNGLTKTVNNVQLGGALTQNTVIGGAGLYDLDLGSTGSRLDVLRANASDMILNATNFINLTAANATDTFEVVASTGNAALNAFNSLDSTATYVEALLTGYSVQTIDTTGAFTNRFKMNNSGIDSFVITDALNSKGAIYAADYSANFVNESLVTKRYVDVAITALTNAAGGINTVANKLMVASTTTASGQQIAAAIAAAPKNDSYVQVFVNGVKCTVGNGVGTTDVYFADPLALGTPKAIAAITAGDVLVRGTGLGYDTDATDVVEYDYQA